MADTKTSNSNHPSKNHNYRKRQPKKQETGNCVIYLSRKASTKALVDKCDKLISNDSKEIIIYCLGAAIQRGILVSLQVCEKHPLFVCHTNTFTTQLIDDLEPAADNEDFKIQRRNNSGLRIRLYRCDQSGTK